MAETTKAPEVVFWDCDPDHEDLSHTEIEEAVEAWADRLHPAPLPETVTVYGFARMEVLPAEVDRLARWALGEVLERLDEELGPPDDSTEPTQAMMDAARVFAETIRSQYMPWACERVTSEVVRAADYVPAEWLDRSAATPQGAAGGAE